MPRNWTAAELDHLDALMGNLPAPELAKAYNDWALKHGYRTRTLCGIRAKAYRNQLSMRAYGDWITTGVIARTLGCCHKVAQRWIDHGYLPARQVHYGDWAPWYVRRADLVALARRQPELFGGFERGQLVQLLENEKLADQIATRYPRRRNAPRPVRCVETGQVYASVRDAARAAFVVRQLIQIAARTGQRAGGFHWQILDP